ncbi:hypothetical protein PPTG_24419 [Phytophthora nicotianae INRA-310]|uniref:DUF7869 domain-containing protein n=1 Tax=Phytophthora nicotianae (strain INRA-310) TaxID=761204 RepID=W2PGP9_PHYN3|nr:hypothetical protein PPTG_24419 [Phytophthora nicotianae INRA-310]ETM99393.1 hypothetical protein PPTG_24419 [Phytophthora nicotianae INRA-310]
MAIFSTKNASAVDLRWLVSWFKRFTVSVGDDVPVRVRRKETKEGEIKMYYSNAEYPLLPAYFTWDQLYTVMHNYVEEIALRSGATAAETEAFGEHTTAARRMREEYNVSNTPSQSYFLLLRNVNMFGVFYANKNIQYSDVQIVVPAGFQKLTFYADNCGGQTKNNFVVRMLLALAHTSLLDEINLKFFVEGHTKNAVDRGFGHVQRQIARADAWTMNQLLGVVKEASSSSALVHIPNQNPIFKVYRDAMEEAYKKLKDIQKYQIFTMREINPGVVP